MGRIYIDGRLQGSKSGKGVVISFLSLFHFSMGLGGWSVRIAKRRIAWKPIDYRKTFIGGGVRTARLPRIHNLDLTGGST